MSESEDSTLTAAGDGAGKRSSAKAKAESVVIALESTKDGLYDLLRDLIAFRTESTAPEATHFPEEARRCLAYVGDFLQNLGFSIETWDVGPSTTFEAHPVMSAQRRGSSKGRSLALNGHLDVVPAGGRSVWTDDPFAGTIRDGRIYGRGATDMKGGIAAALWALKLLFEQGFQPSGDLFIHLVTDEEVVGKGTRAVVDIAPTPDAALSLEPTNLAISPTEGGLVHFRIEIDGVEAHHATRYLSVHAGGKQGGGVNAIEKMVKVITAVQELERQWANLKSHELLPPGYGTLLPGLIAGGSGGGHDGRLNVSTNAGTTPNYCSVEYGMWYFPSESLEEVRAEVETYVYNLCQLDPWLREHPPRFTWGVREIQLPAFDVPVDHPVTKILSECLSKRGLDPTAVGFAAATDLAWYGERGIPGVIFGPGSLEQAHAANEFILLDDVVRAAEVYALFIEEWCG